MIIALEGCVGLCFAASVGSSCTSCLAEGDASYATTLAHLAIISTIDLIVEDRVPNLPWKTVKR